MFLCRLGVCKGRIEGSHPVFLLRDSLLAVKLLFEGHKNTLHWGVVLTMTNHDNT